MSLIRATSLVETVVILLLLAGCAPVGSGEGGNTAGTALPAETCSIPN